MISGAINTACKLAVPKPVREAVGSIVDCPMGSDQTAATLDKVDLSKFQADKVFTPNNAATMAALATLAYSAPADQKRHVEEQKGVVSYHFLDSKNNKKLGIDAPDTGTQLTVVETRNALLVAARGTSPPWLSNLGKNMEVQKQDYLNDADTTPVPNYDGSALVHEGFKNAADGIWGQVSPLLQQAAAAHKAIHFAGHSLGAAVALQLADRAHEQLHIMPESITRTGGPDIGWADEQKHLDESGLAARTVNFINNGDPVPHALPCGDAAGHEVYFNHDGLAELGNKSHRLDRLAGLADGLAHYNINPLYDHIPGFYNDRIEDPRNQAVLQKLQTQLDSASRRGHAQPK